MIHRLLLCLLAALATACAPAARLVLVPEAPSQASVRPLVSTFVVRDIELPDYAASDEVFVLDDSGVLSALSGVLWAATPEQTIRSGLVEALGDITGARVAGEPWPFSTLPAAEITVRVSRLTGQPGGALNFAGQYAIAPIDSGLADRSGRFDIRVPVQGEDAQALGRAQAAAVTELAETIARRVSR